jgi:pimeloyl-ACP methyl ester carboxylesterase
MDSRSGRAIGVSGLGDPTAQRLVLFCHPAPGASGFDPDPDVTAASGLRLMSLDRPGYGATDPASTDHVDVWIDDVSELLGMIEQSAQEATGTDYGAIAVIGWGVGSVYAAALAALRPGLIDRLVLVSPPAPGSETADDALLRDEVDESRHPGFGDRRARMLENAANGPDGLAFDHALLASDWASHLPAVRAPTLVVATDEAGVRPWVDRIPDARLDARTSPSGALIADAWADVLTRCHAEPAR